MLERAAGSPPTQATADALGWPGSTRAVGWRGVLTRSSYSPLTTLHSPLSYTWSPFWDGKGVGDAWGSLPFKLQVPSLNGALGSHQSPRTSRLHSGGKAPPSPLRSPSSKCLSSSICPPWSPSTLDRKDPGLGEAGSCPPIRVSVNSTQAVQGSGMASVGGRAADHSVPHGH